MTLHHLVGYHYLSLLNVFKYHHRNDKKMKNKPPIHPWAGYGSESFEYLN